MTVKIDYEYEEVLTFDYVELANELVATVLAQEKCPYEAEVSVVLTNNDTIQRVNKRFRQIDQPTDVLSFPMNSFSSPAEYDFLEQAEDCFNPESGELILGDIMISVPKLYEQSAEYGHSEIREYAFLLTHSLLHLLGYDHKDESGREIMEDKQEHILELLHISR